MEIRRQAELQSNIVNNSKSLQEYYREFGNWEKEISEKDKILAKTDFKPKKSDYLLVRDDQESEDLKGIPIKIPTKKKKVKEDKTLKRDGNAIKDYYNKWDQFDPEEDEEEDEEQKSKENKSKTSNANNSNKNSDSGVITSNNINTEHYKMKSDARTNSNIQIKSSRGGNNDAYFSSEVNRLKSEVIKY